MDRDSMWSAEAFNRLTAAHGRAALNKQILATVETGGQDRWQVAIDPAALTARLNRLGLSAEISRLFEEGPAIGAIIQHAGAEMLSIGPRELARGANLTSRVVQLRRQDGARGSGLEIAPRLLVTAGHVLPDPAHAEGAVAHRAGEPSRGIAPGQLFYSDPSLNFTIVALGRPTDAGLDHRGPAPLDSIAPEVVAGDRLNIVVSEVDSGTTAAVSARLWLVTSDRLFYEFDGPQTGDGAPPPVAMPRPEARDGSPIFDAEWRLVGIHHADGRALAEGVRAGRVADAVRRLMDAAADQPEWSRRLRQALGEPTSTTTPASTRSDAPEPHRPPIASIPLRIDISLVTDNAASGTPSEERADSDVGARAPSGPEYAVGPVQWIPEPGIDVQLTDGVDAVPQWTNESALGQDGAQHFDRARDEYLSDGDMHRMWYWSTRILLEAASYTPAQSLNLPVRNLAAGFLDLPRERHPDGQFGLVIYVYAGTPTGATDAPPTHLPSLEIDNERFPVVVRPIWQELQQPSVLPADGASSCWIQTRTWTTEPRGPGGLTARHVVDGVPIGGSVPLDDGTFGKLLDVAPGAIDAAVVELPNAPTGRRNPLEVNPYIAPLLPVTLRIPHGTTIETNVVDVSNTFRVFNEPSIPVQFSLSRFGRPGDSGSLICDEHDRAAGIYIGKLADLQGRQLGFAQLLYQVGEVLEGMEILA